ncbi:(Fe-S)-binding protein, partial [bacterium]|nr:(Fe-S)-binding protein [bacterium]
DDFIEENSFPIFKEHDVLYWMGCMGRYDFSYQKVALAVSKILTAAGIHWGILKNEKCTGDAARRAGNELVFQMLAEHNIEILNNAAPKLILTTCPHCLRTLQEYRDIGLNPDIPIVHHSEYFNRLTKEGRIRLSQSNGQEIACHDACYISRYIGGEATEYPRQLLTQTGATLREPDRNRERSFCCGAGGGLLFTEETAGERINHNRVKELLGTGASTIGTACPFCQLMLRDGLRDLEKETIAVKDIAELMAEHLPE